MGERGEKLGMEEHRIKKGTQKGRAKTGVILAIKKGTYKEVEWKINESKEILGMAVSKGNRKMLIVVVYMNKEMERNYKVMKDWIEQDPTRETIIGGDFNARTGEGGLFYEFGERTMRKNIDKIVNTNGKIMIEWMNENPMRTFNGTKEKDKEEFTYIGARGNTVIDYIVTRKVDENLKIKESSRADHMKLMLGWREANRNVKQEVTKRIMSWSKEDIEVFKEKLKNIDEENKWERINK